MPDIYYSASGMEPILTGLMRGGQDRTAKRCLIRLSVDRIQLVG